MSSPRIQKADSGVFYIHWTDGQRSKRVSTRQTNRKAAEAFLAAWIIDTHNADKEDRAQTVTVADLWAEYQTRHVDAKVASKSTARFCWANLEPFFGKLHPSQITQDLVEEYQTTRGKPRKGCRGSKSVMIPGAKSATVRRELIVLRACLNWAADPKRKIISKDVVPVYALPEDGEARDRWLSLTESQMLLSTARTRREAARRPANTLSRLSRAERFLWIALETAARATAILELTWDRVDFETGMIHFDVPGRKKTKKRRAAVPISSALRPVLLRAQEERIGDLVLDNGAKVWKLVSEVAKAAGVAGVSPHVLRHTAATQMARKGVPLWVVAGILGNSVKMIEQVYAKHHPEALAQAIERISDGMLDGPDATAPVADPELEPA